MTTLLMLVCAIAPTGAAVSTAPATAPTTTPASRPAPVPFQPGVSVDFARQRVEVAATVILREGALELFACSPQIREHESIVRIEARPLHVFQAIGLIGVAPGHPVQFNPTTGTVEPATGDPLAIHVRWEQDGRQREEPIERWMRLARFDGDHTMRSPTPDLPWVFAGSHFLEPDLLAADTEGTVIAVVDFGSALIALPELHSDQNENLWLQPATSRIPPLDTPCTLVIQPGPLRLTIDAWGRLRHDGRDIDLAELTLVVQRYRTDMPSRRVLVTCRRETPWARLSAVMAVLRSQGIPRDQIDTRTQPAASRPAPGTSQAPRLSELFDEIAGGDVRETPQRFPPWRRAVGGLCGRAAELAARTVTGAAELRDLIERLPEALSPARPDQTLTAPPPRPHRAR